jgi:hypothetical protein
MNALEKDAFKMIEVSYILHNLDKNGKRLKTQNFIRKCIVDKVETILEQWAYLKGSTEVEIRSTRKVTEQEVATSKATANRIASDYRPGVYNGD